MILLRRSVIVCCWAEERLLKPLGPLFGCVYLCLSVCPYVAEVDKFCARRSNTPRRRLVVTCNWRSRSCLEFQPWRREIIGRKWNRNYIRRWCSASWTTASHQRRRWRSIRGPSRGSRQSAEAAVVEWDLTTADRLRRTRSHRCDRRVGSRRGIRPSPPAARTARRRHQAERPRPCRRPGRRATIWTGAGECSCMIGWAGLVLVPRRRYEYNRTRDRRPGRRSRPRRALRPDVGDPLAGTTLTCRPPSRRHCWLTSTTSAFRWGSRWNIEELESCVYARQHASLIFHCDC